MSENTESKRKPMALVTSSTNEVPAPFASSLRRKRSAVDKSEDADARLTGMTRSLDRRLLALNLQPMPPVGSFSYRKVA